MYEREEQVGGALASWEFHGRQVHQYRRALGPDKSWFAPPLSLGVPIWSFAILTHFLARQTGFLRELFFNL